MNKVIINTLDNAPKVPFNLDGKILFSSGKLEIIHLALQPGEGIEQHTQPFDVVFFILSGKGIMETGEENFEGKENTSIFVKAGLPRGLTNSGTDVLKVLVIKDLT